MSRYMLWVILVAVFLSGCATYRPLPLTRQAVAGRLIGPDMKNIRIRAKEIKHPILKSIEFNDSDGLSPDEAAVLAVLANPRLRAIRDRQNIANAQLLQAGLLPNPRLSYSMDFPTGGETTGTVNAFGVGLDWDVDSLITRGARMDAAQAHAGSVNLEIAWQEWQVAEAAKTAVYRLIVSDKQVQLAARILQRVKDNLNLIHKAVEARQLTELELAAAQTAYNQARTTLANLRKQAYQQRLVLNETIGMPPANIVRLQTGIKLPHRLKPASYRMLAGDVGNHRLDIVALRLGYNSRQAALRAAILEQFPKISIGFNHARDNSDVHSTGFAVSIDLPVFNRNQGRVAFERASRKQLFDEYVSRIFQARSNIARLLANIRSVSELIQIAQDSVPSLKQLVQTYRTAVNRGQADVLSYYSAWNALTEKQIDILSLRQQLMELGIALELACGQYNVNTAGQESVQ